MGRGPIDEKRESPPWIRRGAAARSASLPGWFDPSPKHRHQPPPPWPLAPASPPQLRRGAYFQMKIAHPHGQGGLHGGQGATHNLVRVVDRGLTPVLRVTPPAGRGF